MNTHILYRCCHARYKQYFSGIYTGEVENGLLLVKFHWDSNKSKATIMSTSDAWDLVSMCRKQWPHITIEVERIVTLEEIQTHIA